MVVLLVAPLMFMVSLGSEGVQCCMVCWESAGLIRNGEQSPRLGSLVSTHAVSPPTPTLLLVEQIHLLTSFLDDTYPLIICDLRHHLKSLSALPLLRLQGLIKINPSNAEFRFYIIF